MFNEKKTIMSRLFEQFIQDVFAENPYLHDEAKQHQAEAQEQQFDEARIECNPIDSTVLEWEQLNKPNIYNNILKNN
tara:strand:+ start:123 stop:353 length:231 start_codon:yes stop_codon:yes gene_type:complete